MKAMKVFIASFLMLGLCAGTQMINPGSALAAGKTANGGADVQRVPMTLTVHNPCCDEDVEITAEFLVITKSSQSASGRQHVLQILRANKATGVGETGTEYQGTVGSQGAVNADSTGETGTGTVHQKWTFTSDNGCSFTLTLSVKVTITPNGDVVIQTSDESVKCEGDLE